MKQVLKGCLALALMVCLTGCGEKAAEGTDLFSQASGIASDQVLLTVDGRDVTAGRYFYWLAYNCDYLRDCYTDSKQEMNWEENYDGRTVGEYAREQALSTTILYAEIEIWADRYGCAVTDDEWKAIDAEWDAAAEKAGGEATYLTELAGYGVDRAFARDLSADYYLYNHLYDLSRTEGSALYPSQTELDQYAADSGLITVEEQQFSDAAAAAKALSTLTASSQPLTDFANLGGTYQKNTIVPGDGKLPEDLESAAKALSQDTWSKVVTSGDRFYILLRRAPDTEALNSGYFDSLLQAAADAAKVEFSSAYDQINVGTFYKKLMAARTTSEEDLASNPSASSASSSS